MIVVATTVQVFEAWTMNSVFFQQCSQLLLDNHPLFCQDCIRSKHNWQLSTGFWCQSTCIQIRNSFDKVTALGLDGCA